MVPDDREDFHGEAFSQKTVNSFSDVKILLLIGLPHVVGRNVPREVDVRELLKFDESLSISFENLININM